MISYDLEVVNNWCATEAADQHNNKAVCHSSCVAGQQLWAGQPANAHWCPQFEKTKKKQDLVLARRVA